MSQSRRGRPAPKGARLVENLTDAKWHPLHNRMKLERVEEKDIMQAACKLAGLESMNQIKVAVLETSGDISIVPKMQPLDMAALREEIHAAIRMRC